MFFFLKKNIIPMKLYAYSHEMQWTLHISSREIPMKNRSLADRCLGSSVHAAWSLNRGSEKVGPVDDGITKTQSLWSMVYNGIITVDYYKLYIIILIINEICFIIV